MLIFPKSVELDKDHPALSVAVMTRRNCETFNIIFPEGAPTPLIYIDKPNDVQPYSTGYLNAVHNLTIPNRLLVEPGSEGKITYKTQEGVEKEIIVCVEGAVRER